MSVYSNIRRGYLFVFWVLFLSGSLAGQTRVFEYSDLLKLRTVAEAAISPDGKYIAYTVNSPRPLTDKAGGDYRELYLYELSTQKITELLTGKVNVTSIQWVPGSKNIAFRARLSNSGAPQIYFISAQGGEPFVITDFKTPVQNYSLSPDGKKIIYTAGEKRFPEKDDYLNRGFDAVIFEEEYENITLYSYDISSKEIKALTKDVSVFSFTLSPDGLYAACQIAEKNLVDDSYLFKRIYSVNTVTGEKKLLAENPGKISDMSWSPDGKHLAFIAGVDINDPVSGSLFVASFAEYKKFTDLTNYTLNFEGSVTGVDWLDANTMIYSSEESVDHTLRTVTIDGRKRELILIGGKYIFSSFEPADKKILLLGNTSLHPSELVLYDMAGKTTERLTEHNPFLKDIKFGRQEKISYKSRDGWTIEGVLIYPADYSSGKSYPLITYIHGGPEACVSNGWLTGYGTWGQIAAGEGYFIFFPNYRASSGRGVEFAKADRGDLAGKEFEDVIDGIDLLISEGKVDKNRVGIGGGSYGGYFSAWGATKYTERFAASVVFVGVSNQISKALTTDIPYEDYYVHWGIWPHENFELYLDRSPVKWAPGSKTPTLILHGKEDPRVPPLQSVELYRSLKLHGKAPVRLVFYPGEGHGNRKNTSRLDYVVRTMDWFNYYLRDNKDKTKMPAMYYDIK